MKLKTSILTIAIVGLSIAQLGMGRNSGQYDEEARQQEREAHQQAKAEKKARKNPAKNIAEGVKQITVDNTSDLLSDTAEGTKEDAPVIGTLEGVREGSGKVLDNTVKGAVKVATLGYGNADNYEVEEPEQGTDETTKIKIKIPGT